MPDARRELTPGEMRERQLAAVRRLLRDAGFMDGTEVAKVVVRIERERRP